MRVFHTLIKNLSVRDDWAGHKCHHFHKCRQLTKNMRVILCLGAYMRKMSNIWSLLVSFFSNNCVYELYGLKNRVDRFVRCINLNIVHRNCFNPVQRIIDYHFQRIEGHYKSLMTSKISYMWRILFLIFNCGSPTSWAAMQIYGITVCCIHTGI